MSVIDDLRREVRETETVIGSAIALIGSLATRLRNAVANGNMAEIEDLAADLDRQQNALANAVAAGTVAEDEEPLPEGEDEPADEGGPIDDLDPDAPEEGDEETPADPGVA